MFTVYLLRCSNGAFYVGLTDDLPRRLAEHQPGEGARYTREHRPVVLLWNEAHPVRESAEDREAQIKRWTRAKKEALAEGNLSRLELL